MQRGKFDQRYVAFDRNPEVVERVIRCRLSDKIARCRVKDRVVPVKDLLESRAIDVLGLTNIQNLAISESRIVTPAPVRRLVTFPPFRCQPRFMFVIKYAV